MADIETRFTEAVKKHFMDAMSVEACDMAEVLFNSIHEKHCFIENAWHDYGDDIEAFVDGEGSMEEFLELPNPAQYEVVLGAIKANFESIFDKSFDE